MGASPVRRISQRRKQTADSCDISCAQRQFTRFLLVKSYLARHLEPIGGPTAFPSLASFFCPVRSLPPFNFPI
jgi:hypothetical protein